MSLQTTVEPEIRATRQSAWPVRAVAFWMVVLLIAVAGGSCIWRITRESPGLSADSKGYLMAARAVMRGRGVTILNGNGTETPLTQLAPLYPVALAASAAASTDVLIPARLLNSVLFAANITLIALLVRRMTGSPWAAIFSAAVMLTSCIMLQIHVMIWSEALFLFFTLLGISFLERYLRADALGWLCAAALVSALAFATRYSGAAFVLAASLAIALFHPGILRRRLILAAAFCILSSIPMLAWFGRNLFLTGNAASRSIRFHPPTWSSLQVGLLTVAEPFVPPRGVATVAAGVTVAAALFVFCAVRLLRVSRGESQRALVPRIAIIFMLVYVAVIMASLIFFDAFTPLDRRILSPLFPLGVVTIFGVWGLMDSRKAVRLAGALVIVAFLGVQSVRAATWMREAPHKWLGFGSRKWNESDLLRYAKSQPPDRIIYSNADDLIYLRANRFAKPIPRTADPVAGVTDGRYVLKLEGMRTDLARRRGCLIYFNNVSRSYRISEGRLRSMLKLKLDYSGQDGDVLVASSKTRKAKSRKSATTNPH